MDDLISVFFIDEAMKEQQKLFELPPAAPEFFSPPPKDVEVKFSVFNTIKHPGPDPKSTCVPRRISR